MATSRQIEALLADPKPLLEALGLEAVAYSRDAFQKQAWGADPWPPRYPFQRAPKINVAGVLADFNAGKTPPARRFEDSPALKDTGELRDSIVHRIVSQTEIEVGTSLEYAGVQNFGGESSQPVTDQAKTRLRKFLKSKTSKKVQSYRQVVKKANPGISKSLLNKMTKQKVPNEALYGQHLNKLLREDTHTTQVAGRQFIGMNAELEQLLAAAVVKAVEDFKP